MAEANPNRTKLLLLANEISGMSIDSLIHPAKAGSFDFESARPLLEGIIGFYREVVSASYTSVPDNLLGDAANTAESATRSLKELQNFDIKSGDPNQISNNLRSRLANDWQQSFHHTAHFVAFGHLSPTEINNRIEQINALNKSIASEAKKAADDYAAKISTSEQGLKAQKDELEKVMAVARQASKFEAVTAQSRAFADEAKSAQWASWIWAGGTVLTVIASLIFIWAVFLKNLHPAVTSANPIPSNPSVASGSNQPVVIATNASPANDAVESKAITASLLQQTIARVLIVTLLYSAVIWCARNYFAAKHNFTVNRHRQNAMNTFRAFVEGTDDKTTQDFILRQAAVCAFAPQQSGYLKDESLPTPGPASQIVDMVKPGGKAE